MSGEVALIACGICEGPADDLGFGCKNEKGEQMAAGIAQHEIAGQPVIVVTLILGGKQVTATLDATQSDRFAHRLADAVLWQNDQLRQKAGQAVH